MLGKESKAAVYDTVQGPITVWWTNRLKIKFQVYMMQYINSKLKFCVESIFAKINTKFLT